MGVGSLLSTRYGMPRKIPMLTRPSRIMGFLRMDKTETTNHGTPLAATPEDVPDNPVRQ